MILAALARDRHGTISSMCVKNGSRFMKSHIPRPRSENVPDPFVNPAPVRESIDCDQSDE